MHIELLPAVLPPERSLSATSPRVELTPGQRVTATVLSPDLDGRPMLTFAGRQVASQTPLPFPPGTKLILEVVEQQAGGQQSVRVVATPPTQAPVSPVSYGYAAAVMAAGAAVDVQSASDALLQWLPVLTSRGVVTLEQAQALVRDLGPVPVLVQRREEGHTPGQGQQRGDGSPGGQGGGKAEAGPGGAVGEGLARTLAATLAAALADRVGHSSALLEARLARAGGAAEQVDRLMSEDVRGRLALLLQSAASVLPGTELASLT